MTTREQLGLNANWIPMDSSKSGGSDEFLIKKVNDLESKLNAIDDSRYGDIINKTMMGPPSFPTFTLRVDNTESNKKVVIYVDNPTKDSNVKFKIKGSDVVYSLSKDNNQVEIDVPEVINSKLSEYGVHAYVLNLKLTNVESTYNNLMVTYINQFNKQSGFDKGENTGSPEFSTLERSILILDANTSKTREIVHASNKPDLSQGQNDNRVNALKLISSSIQENSFDISSNGSSLGNAYIHPSNKDSLSQDGRQIRNVNSFKMIEVYLDSGNSLVVKEDIVTWKPLTETLKSKLRPMVVNMRGYDVSEYGYYGDKSGFPVMVYAPRSYDCISFIHKTDSSEWIGYFYKNVSTFIKNSNKVPKTSTQPFTSSKDNRRNSFSITTNSVEYNGIESDSYNLNNLYSQGIKDIQPESNDENLAIKSFTLRSHVGLTLNDFNNDKTVEVWSFLPTVINANSPTISGSAISSLINMDNGNFITANANYNKWKDNKCVVHQTLGKAGNVIVVKNIEIVTLDVFFKAFIAKSNEWATKNPGKVEDGRSLKGNFNRQFTWNGSLGYY